MRVALDVTPLIGARTGIGVLTAGLVDALQQRNDVSVVPVALSWRGRSQAGAEHAPIPARLIHNVWRRADVLPISWWTGRVDVVHGTNYVVGPSDRRRTPRIVTVHDLASVHTPERCDEATRVFPELVKRSVRSGAYVQTDSETVAQEVRAWLGIEPERVRAVLPGLPDAVEPSEADAVPSVLGRRFLLTIGTEEPRKGLDRFAAIFGRVASIDDEVLWVHAGARGWGAAELDEACAALPESVRVRIFRLGRVGAGTKAWLLRRAAVFVYPSLEEGFGFPPLEALVAGVPVVVSDLPVLREVLGSHAAFVPLEAFDEWVGAVSVALTSSATDPSAFEAGMAHGRGFRWDQTAANQVAFYRAVIGA